MAVRKPSQHQETRRPNNAATTTPSRASAADIAAEVSATQPTPPAEDPVFEAERYAKAAGALWKALEDNNVPLKFRDAMFCNWLNAYWGVSEEVIVCETAMDEGEPA